MIGWLHTHRLQLARILLGLFLAIWANGVVFRHAHRLSDGRVIVHAHPYWPFGKGPILPNNHTAQEILLLDLAAHLPVVVSAFFAFLFLLRSYQHCLFWSKTYSFRSATSFTCFAHRGPPVVR
ncbi:MULTISPECIES: hypothetical protein [Spirosoma]|uniref:Uncharacterized protein n=1 Tax=Spirosoma liriopis TaxID=2937440 RepID=A0ABT0HMH3_9BACT|nr:MULTISPECIES: hypothetical protein [Spirosoma]MCK8493363.1 hypothetical protein [Spirosoma liriopis]UHG92750.1 hypothetical protein LQ777_07560 [Spirosoma oryzicola]